MTDRWKLTVQVVGNTTFRTVVVQLFAIGNHYELHHRSGGGGGLVNRTHRMRTVLFPHTVPTYRTHVHAQAHTLPQYSTIMPNTISIIIQFGHVKHSAANFRLRYCRCRCRCHCHCCSCSRSRGSGEERESRSCKTCSVTGITCRHCQLQPSALVPALVPAPAAIRVNRMSPLKCRAT